MREPLHTEGGARLPLVTLYLSERCNSRCITCDYWRHGRTDLDLGAVERLLPALGRLGTRTVLLSGGEPLLNPDWQPIAELLRGAGLGLWLLTSGLSLAKHAAAVARLCERVTVSLDGTDAVTYRDIRGLDAFDTVCAGVRAAVRAGVPVGVRVTLQRRNYRQLAGFVDLAAQLGACEVSFLAVDVANPHAFARRQPVLPDLALTEADLPRFAGLVSELERTHAAAFRSGFIAESAARLAHIGRYFAAVCRGDGYPAVRCNAPEFSAVIDAHGGVSPCFFIRGAAAVGLGTAELDAVWTSGPMHSQRAAIRAGEAPQCRTCVCSLWRDPQALAPPMRPLAEAVHG